MAVSLDGSNHHSFRNSKKEDEGSCGTASLTSIPVEVMEQIDLATIPEHTKDKKVTGSNQHRFTKGKSSLTSWLGGRARGVAQRPAGGQSVLVHPRG